MRMEPPVAKRDKSAARSQKPPRRTKSKARQAAVRKKATNLTLDPAAVARGEEYGRLHGASLSQLVTDLLYALPDPSDELQVHELTPAVRRLYGVASGRGDSSDAREAYRTHLERKYGGQSR